ncbi:hypothetical protein AB0G67_36705 [Streptomyces sp. NPDC021056]|uniref:hypothetical protein n=1 Tax=Streptomyces sp. NPDC021056 TaxID=3155012 RepID=UPI003407375E
MSVPPHRSGNGPTDDQVVLGASQLTVLLLSSWCYDRTLVRSTVDRYGGVFCTTALYVCSLSFSGTPASLLPEPDFHVVGLQSTAVLAIPVGFLLGWAGSVAGRRAGRAEGAGTDVRWRERVLVGAREE